MACDEVGMSAVKGLAPENGKARSTSQEHRTRTLGCGNRV